MDVSWSRLGRASSRYGPTSSFIGPVRKWKKQWVHVSHSKDTNNDTNAVTYTLRLCRWTPTKPEENPDEPPRRKFRYTPVVDLEERKSENTHKVDENSKPRKVQSLPVETISHSDDIISPPTEKNQVAYKDLKHSSAGLLNLELDLNGCDEDSESEVEVELP